jgi:hypothetical protein
MKKLRGNGAHVRSKPDDPPSDVDHILNLVRALTDDQRTDLFTRLKESGPGRGVPQSPGPYRRLRSGEATRASTMMI